MIKYGPPYDGPQVAGRAALLQAGGTAELLVNVQLCQPQRGLLTLQAPLAASPTWIVEQGAGYALISETITPTTEVTRVDVGCQTIRVSCSLAAADGLAIALYGVQS